jgi:uncharacterized ParB-like nuclease family protein
MKKGKRLLLLIAVIAVFIAGALALKSMNAAREAADKAAATEEKPVVLSVDKNSLMEISYTNGEETLRFTKAEDHWQYASDPAFPLNESKVTAMADALSSLTASRKVADTLDQAEEYGLKTPSCTVAVVMADGTKQTLYFGDKNTVTNDTYAYVDGSQTVYTVASSVTSNFSSKLYGLIADEAFPTIDASSISNVTYAALDKNLKLSYFPQSSDKSYSSMYTWFSVGEDGSLAPLDDDKISTYFGTITGIAPTGTVDYDATGDELAAYGLDVPAATITVDYTVSHQESVPKATDAAVPSITPAASPDAAAVTPGTNTAAPEGTAAQVSPSPTLEMETITVQEPKQITITLGKQAEDGSYYMRHSDSKRVFAISADTYTKLTELALENLRPAQFCLIPINTVDGLSFTMDGKTSDFTITRTNTTDKDGKTTTAAVYKMGDTEIGEGVFKSFYTSLISLGKEKTADQTVSGQPYITVIFHRNTANFKEMTLTLYPYDSSFYRAEFNGESGMLVNKRDVEALVAAYQALGN